MTLRSEPGGSPPPAWDPAAWTTTSAPAATPWATTAKAAVPPWRAPSTTSSRPAGAEIRVEKGKSYPIEVLISEVPGGAFGFVLLTQQKEGDRYDNNKFDLFRTNFSNPTKEDLEKLISAENCSMGAMEIPVFNQDFPHLARRSLTDFGWPEWRDWIMMSRATPESTICRNCHLLW